MTNQETVKMLRTIKGTVYLWNRKFEDAISYAISALEQPVEPPRMRGKGRWNVYYHGEENGKSIFSYSCNQCGYSAPYNLIGGVCEQKKWNFCPNCGADMRGEQDENDRR